MKTSFRLQPRRPLTRSEAWGCFTANLAMPGSGSLVAGRAVGYAQIALSLIGLGVTLICGIQFLLWYVRNWETMTSQMEDPVTQLQTLWAAMRWPLLGIVIFVVAVLWALATSMAVLTATPKKTNLPPRL